MAEKKHWTYEHEDPTAYKELGNGYVITYKYGKTAGNTFRSLRKYTKTASAMFK